MTPGLIMTLIYGVLALLGGIIGYRQAKSKMSLISGSISGVLLLVAGVLMLQNSATGLWLSKIISVVLVAVFISRLVKTQKFMPAGLMVIVGIATLIANFV